MPGPCDCCDGSDECKCLKCGCNKLETNHVSVACPTCDQDICSCKPQTDDAEPESEKHPYTCPCGEKCLCSPLDHCGHSICMAPERRVTIPGVLSAANPSSQPSPNDPPEGAEAIAGPSNLNLPPDAEQIALAMRLLQLTASLSASSNAYMKRQRYCYCNCCRRARCTSCYVHVSWGPRSDSCKHCGAKLSSDSDSDYGSRPRRRARSTYSEDEYRELDEEVGTAMKEALSDCYGFADGRLKKSDSDGDSSDDEYADYGFRRVMRRDSSSKVTTDAAENVALDQIPLSQSDEDCTVDKAIAEAKRDENPKEKEETSECEKSTEPIDETKESSSEE